MLGFNSKQLTGVGIFLFMIFIGVPLAIGVTGRWDFYFTLTSVALLAIASAGVWLTFYIGRINIGQGAFAGVEAEAGLARAGVEPVAVEAMRGEDRADLPDEVGRIGGAAGEGRSHEQDGREGRAQPHRRPLRPNMNCGRIWWVVWGRP